MKRFRYFYMYFSPDDESPLVISIKKGRQKVSKYLIGKGSDIKNDSNKKLLFKSCNKEICFKHVEYLLSKETNFKITNNGILLN